MFKDFSELNSLAPQLVESALAQEVRNALSVESGLVASINDAVNSYVDLYNRVRFTRVNPDTRTPEDVTTAESNSAANSVLSRLRASLGERKTLLGIYRDNISDQMTAEDITRTVTTAVPGINSTANHAFVNILGVSVPLDEIDSDLEAHLSSLPLSPFSVNNRVDAASVTSQFLSCGSFFWEWNLDGASSLGWCAHYADQTNDRHVIAGSYPTARDAVAFAAYWYESTGSGVVFYAINASQQRRGVITAATSVASALEKIAIVCGALSVSYSRQPTRTFASVTKGDCATYVVVESVSKEETFHISGADVVNQMFVSDAALGDAIDALADTTV